MEALPCGHVAEAGDIRMCEHLVAEKPPWASYRWLTGRGIEYVRLCEPCVENGFSATITVCAGCVARVEEKTHSRGTRGRPEFRRRDYGPLAEPTSVACTVVPRNEYCLAALPQGWLALTEDSLIRIADDGGTTFVGEVDFDEWYDPDDPNSPEAIGDVEIGSGLHVSPDGRFAAVVTNFGRYGVVIDLSDASVVLELDRTFEDNWTTFFPFAFLPDGTFVTATANNCLDRFDLSTGECLTERDMSYGTERYVDCFHGGLTLSPSGRWLIDDGWVWHPVGVLSAIDVVAWSADRYLAEHGITIDDPDEWNRPLAWLDDEVVAVQRIGRSWTEIVDGVTLYRAPTFEQVGQFYGPVGRMWAHRGRLHTVTPEGMEVWDPADGARTGLLKGFSPTAYNRAAGVFAQLTGEELRTWR
jgi:hypothetical protein